MVAVVLVAVLALGDVVVLLEIRSEAARLREPGEKLIGGRERNP